jgi:hypothetical protein
MMEAARTSETLVNFYQTTRCYNPEDSNLRSLPCPQEPATGRYPEPSLDLRCPERHFILSEYVCPGKTFYLMIFNLLLLYYK